MVRRDPDMPPPWRPADQQAQYIADRLWIYRIALNVARHTEWPEGLYCDDVVSLARFLAGDTQ
jgi:hypothetical protein